MARKPPKKKSKVLKVKKPLRLWTKANLVEAVRQLRRELLKLEKLRPTKKSPAEKARKTKADLERENRSIHEKLQHEMQELRELQVIHKQTAALLEESNGIIGTHQRHVEMFTQERKRLMEYKRRCTIWGQLISATISLLPEPQGAAIRLLVSMFGLNRKVGEDLDSKDESQTVGYTPHYSGEQLVSAAREAARRSPDWAVTEEDDMANPRRAAELQQAESSAAADQKAGLPKDLGSGWSIEMTPVMDEDIFDKPQ